MAANEQNVPAAARISSRRPLIPTSNSRQDIGFIQELNLENPSQEQLQNLFPGYTTFAGAPRGDQTCYDTAVLVSTDYGPAKLETKASCSRATFVTISDKGLLLVSIHGPLKKMQAFHQDIIATVARYQQAGWSPIIGGTFNLAPTPADRRGRPKRHEEGLMDLYTDTLKLCNACEALTELANPSPTTDRSQYYTHKRRGNTGHVYISRVDHILLPQRLLDAERAKYGHSDVGNFSDHKRITLFAPQTPQK
ncbi:hypothetical protein GGH96_004619 [Coemansia sp. RSA 1972]|nr:hypothetical protein GGH96_004619 [Coemansia sp. RSA 1972]